MDNQNKDMKKTDELEKCFVIMPISDKEGYEPGHFTKVYEQIFKPAIKEAGYEPYRVDEEALSQSIIQKIFNGLTKFPMSICDLSSGNPNVLYELGIRHSYDLPVVLVKDDKTNFIFDVSGINTIEYKSDRLYENVMIAREKLQKAIEETKHAAKNGTLLRHISVTKAIYSTDDIKEEDKQELILKEILTQITNLTKINSEIEKNNIVKTGNDYNLIYDMDDTDKICNKLEAMFNSLTVILNRIPTYDEFCKYMEGIASDNVIKLFYADKVNNKITLRDKKLSNNRRNFTSTK